MTCPEGFMTAIFLRLDALDTAQTEVKSEGSGQRDEILKDVYLDMDALVAHVQEAVNSAPLSAFTITESCHLHIQNKGGRKASSFALENGMTSVIKLTAASGGNHIAHQWFYSIDNQVIWIRVDATIWNRTRISGWTPGMVVWFNHQVIDTTGSQPMEGPKSK